MPLFTPPGAPFQPGSYPYMNPSPFGTPPAMGTPPTAPPPQMAAQPPMQTTNATGGPTMMGEPRSSIYSQMYRMGVWQ